MNMSTHTNGYTKDIDAAVTQMIFNESNKYHLTLSPRKGFDLGFLERSFNHLMILMNERLYGKRYKNQGNYIAGIVVFENTNKENPHFHVVIRDPNGDLEDRCSVESALRMVIPRIRVSLNAKSSRRLIGEDSYLLQRYTNDGSNKLERYLSKEFKARGGIKALTHLDNLSLLNGDGALFGTRDRSF